MRYLCIVVFCFCTSVVIADEIIPTLANSLPPAAPTPARPETPVEIPPEKLAIFTPAEATQTYDSLVKSGVEKYRQARYQEAIDDFSKAIEINPNDAILYNNRGVAFRKLGKGQEAIMDYTTAIRINADYTDAYFNRGNTLYEMGHYEFAINDFDKGLTLDSSVVKGYYLRGICFSEKGDYFSAMVDFTQVLKFDPNNVDALNQRGLNAFRQHDYKTSGDDFNRVIELDPQNVKAYYHRGLSKYFSGNYEAALQDLKIANTMDPNNGDVYMARGETHYEMGNWTDAYYDFKKATELSPKNADYAMLRLWLVKSRFGERKNADRELTKYINERKGEPSVWFGKLSDYLLGKTADKKFLDRKYLQVPGRSENEVMCEAYFFMGMKNLFDGNGKDALAYFDNAVKTNVTYYTEYHSAKTEYARLSVTTPPQVQK